MTHETCMELPAGKTCHQCVHIYRCTKLGYTCAATDTYCDFFPRRFCAATTKVSHAR